MGICEIGCELRSASQVNQGEVPSAAKTTHHAAGIVSQGKLGAGSERLSERVFGGSEVASPRHRVGGQIEGDRVVGVCSGRELANSAH